MNIPLSLSWLTLVTFISVQSTSRAQNDTQNITRQFGSSRNVIHNSSLNYVMTNPLDVQINVGDVGNFLIYTSKPLNGILEISFRCDGGDCSTFDGVLLKPVRLSAEQPNASLSFTSTIAGHDVIELVMNAELPEIDLISNDFAYVRVRVGRSNFLEILSLIFGWSYFFAWSASFYPQNISNYKRKSVVGLNFDYMLLHFTGFIFYAIFNLSLFFSTHVQEEYEDRFPRSEIPVQLNDVVYSIHAAALTSITWIQCLIYESGGHKHSVYSKLLQVAIWCVGAVLMILSILHLFSWLNFIYYFSYLKLIVTGVKYLPQVIFNFRRKSTRGWSVYMIYCDITGGTFGLLQMLTIAFNYNDWKTLIGNLPKLGLSLACIFYDIIFLFQEFVFYRQSNNSKRCKRALEKGERVTVEANSKEPSLSENDENTKMVLCKNSQIDLANQFKLSND